ncbi:MULTISPECIES: monovalent cation/H+ antiporter complex subunit F [Dethiosulfovibrio]|jgi:multicomponent Na+:H+ antiporter subunit F|uniref:Monovalent cation/H+ antiporter complex subunit F n=2 Tax=Dethiosulfovibrio TaxID=47054 RepID=A0ABS9EPM9_9BACT|nr:MULTISPECIES: monovalent cation/H+ antiporter complex subunit F [Dethiosulfovibrio]MCF4113742.1 monovalent cation/H+ antiporter complex subunit F [Dethiosulfovibrio russensis]MCF4141845.1 monovalent cation/H+ antiporter complex subunit F [Dethiosulfovibrio marinus]MCF4143737.1 monovalent cation/H+ antiporter complex subunit F [Dethiosulfovibrio acidaminovorans]
MIGFFALAAGFLTLLVLLMTGRLIMGPTGADRAVALDAMNTLVIGIMILLAAHFESVVMVDVAIVYAALSFVSTMFIARYIEEGRK